MKKVLLPLTAPTKNWRFSASYDSFVVNQTFVLRMNICGKNRQLHVAANRYGQVYEKKTNTEKDRQEKRQRIILIVLKNIF